MMKEHVTEAEIEIAAADPRSSSSLVPMLICGVFDCGWHACRVGIQLDRQSMFDEPSIAMVSSKLKKATRCAARGAAAAAAEMT